MSNTLLTAPISATSGSRRPTFGQVLTILSGMLAAHRQRRQLLQLDDRRLDDIGLDRNQALREAARPFWDGPAYWR